MNGRARGWTLSRAWPVLLVLLGAVPLIWPQIPPLLDLPGHMGRYRVALGIGSSPWLAHYYSYDWWLLGNGAVDLLILPVAWLVGLELAVKLVVMAIPPLTIAAMLFVARAAHGRIPAPSLFALPLAYAAPFQFGFVNFALGMALALLVIGFWLRGPLRIAYAVPAALLVWLMHSAAWGAMGLAIFGIELVRRSPREAVLACLPLAVPAIPMLAMIDSGAAANGGFWLWHLKLANVANLLHDNRPGFDRASAGLVYAVLMLGLFGIGLRFDRRLGVAALLLFAAFLVLPYKVSHSEFADMRLLPYAVALGLLALEPSIDDRRWRGTLLLVGATFLIARIGVQTWNYVELDRQWRSQLAALDHLPRGARVFAMADTGCPGDGWEKRIDFLGNMALVRRDAFVNGQWPSQGVRPLDVRYKAAGAYAYTPSQMLRTPGCPEQGYPQLDVMLSRFPRAAFDHVWLIGVPRDQWPKDPALHPIWQGERGILYRIVRQPPSRG